MRPDGRYPGSPRAVQRRRRYPEVRRTFGRADNPTSCGRYAEEAWGGPPETGQHARRPGTPAVSASASGTARTRRLTAYPAPVPDKHPPSAVGTASPHCLGYAAQPARAEAISRSRAKISFGWARRGGQSHPWRNSCKFGRTDVANCCDSTEFLDFASEITRSAPRLSGTITVIEARSCA